MLRYHISFLLLIMMMMFWSCTNNIEEINALTKKYDITKDVGKNIKMIYSDSAVIKLILEAPTIERYNDMLEPKDVFPDGIFITFMDRNLKPVSWLKADYAVKASRTKVMTVKGNVSFYNVNNDKIQSAELIWDEANKKIYTDKFIKISQPMKGDTVYGMGFIADSELKRIEIKQRVKAKITSSSLLSN